MRVLFFWEAAGLSLDRANPYAALLAEALLSKGVELVAGHAHEFDHAWLEKQRGKIDVLHLNWPHYMYTAADLRTCVAKAEEFITKLAYAHRLGYRIVWTVHNLYPHYSDHHQLDRLVRLALVRYADALIVHCDYARAQVAEHFHRKTDLFVIPHGNFIDAYPNRCSREQARKRLGLSEQHFVYFFFGNVSRYKGIERLLEVFQTLPGDELRLLIAAKIHNNYGEQLVAETADVDSRVLVHPSRFFDSAQFQWFFNAADVGVFPFRKVLTSGSTITALSFGLPVIVPAVGCLPELVDDRVGITYNVNDPDSLKAAMLSIRGREPTAMRAAAMQRARSLDWNEIAEQTAQAYIHSAVNRP